MKLNAQQLRTASDEEGRAATLKQRNPLYLILESVYDTYNIGGLFRLADGLNVEKMYLCGEMERPPNSRIEKASIGTHKIVPWAYFPTVAEAVQNIKEHCHSREGGNPDSHFNSKMDNFRLDPGLRRDDAQQLMVVAVEQDARSVPFTSIHYTAPTALIVGNETYGVLPETLKLATHIAEIPMWGINKSLNVIVSAAIVSFEVMRQQKKS